MTIYTTAAMVAKHGVCPGGTERTAAALAKRGLNMDSRVTMQIILKDLGLSDALFSFSEVEKASRKEAKQVLRQYMRTVAGYACRFILLTHPEYGEALAAANKPINKRCDGIDRPELARKHMVRIGRLHQAETDPSAKHWLNVYRILLSAKPDHIVATHASIALMDGAKAVGVRDEVHQQLVTVLKDLLGPCPMEADSGKDGSAGTA